MLLIIVVGCLLFFCIYKAVPKTAVEKTPRGEAILVNDVILENNIAFFRALNKQQKRQFESEVKEFLEYVEVTGVNTTADNLDKILVAASAVIPVFAFPEWKYLNLEEVLLYGDTFNTQFETDGNNRNIQGMVGTGYMNGKMLLSKHALSEGFKNDSDKNNTAIHEFVHLIDMADGAADGLPEILLQKQYALPWLDMLYKKTKEILTEKSDINPYGTTNEAEFFAVAAEYFFERPDLLEQKHPELYKLLQQIFKQDPEVLLQKRKAKTGRNELCYCGSGLKYKDCCWNKDQQLTA